MLKFRLKSFSISDQDIEDQQAPQAERVESGQSLWQSSAVSDEAQYEVLSRKKVGQPEGQLLSQQPFNRSFTR